jgi:uncharacterized SAM-binding protein YcdF (DUF218 family)
MHKRLRPQSSSLNRLVKWLLAGSLVISAIIPFQVAIARHQAPIPQAIFVLGGDSDRMKFAAQFWQSHPDLKVWISDFSIYEFEDRQFFRQFRVPESQVKFDGRATDTVTNFTSLVDDFAQQKLQHFYLITSNCHMRRARAIATIVLGSRGMIVTPISVPTRNPKPESLLRVLRDCGRSILWLVTGRSGASLNPRLN